jgi:dephospho-CoA kinase
MGRVYVVVTGPPASGKSTLARALADELGLLGGGWPVVEVDTSARVDVPALASRVVCASWG